MRHAVDDRARQMPSVAPQRRDEHQRDERRDAQSGANAVRDGVRDLLAKRVGVSVLVLFLARSRLLRSRPLPVTM